MFSSDPQVEMKNEQFEPVSDDEFQHIIDSQNILPFLLIILSFNVTSNDILILSIHLYITCSNLVEYGC